MIPISRPPLIFSNLSNMYEPIRDAVNKRMTTEVLTTLRITAPKYDAISEDGETMTARDHETMPIGEIVQLLLAIHNHSSSSGSKTTSTGL